MNRKSKVLIVCLAGTVAIVGLGVAAKRFTQHESKARQDELAGIMAFETLSKYAILCELDSNNVDKATKILEIDVFLSLQQIWEYQGLQGILSNRASREAFEMVYPEIRRRVGVDRFEYALPAIRTNAMRFIEEMDSIFKRVAH